MYGNQGQTYMQGANIPVITLDGRRQQIDIYALPAAVGRNGEEADVYLFDESISRIHCRFDVYQGGVTVTDLYSTTGTKVEKQQLNPGQPYLIENGCKIRIGKLKFKVIINQGALFAQQQAYQQQGGQQQVYQQQRFSFDEPPRGYEVESNADPANYPVSGINDELGNDFPDASIDYDSEITEPLKRKPKNDLGGEPTEVIIFSDIEKAFRFPKKILKDNNGELLVTIDKTPFIIGRKPEGTDFVLDVKGISRQHMMIEKNGDDFFVTDLDSTNGVKVNGERILPGDAVKITEGDLIGIGENEYRFEAEQ